MCNSASTFAVKGVESFAEFGVEDLGLYREYVGLYREYLSKIPNDGRCVCSGGGRLVRESDLRQVGWIEESSCGGFRSRTGADAHIVGLVGSGPSGGRCATVCDPVGDDRSGDGAADGVPSGFGPGDGGSEQLAGVSQCVGVGLGEAAHELGPNTLKNREKRAAAKRRKERRKAEGVGRMSGHLVDAGRQGYFSDLPSEVQVQLKASRAELLIARNKRELAVEKSKLDEVSGVQGAMAKMHRTTRLARKLQAGPASSVGGWAKAIAAAAQSAIASAVSGENGSIPTLEELEQGVASAVTGTSAASDREVEYAIRRKVIEETYESSGCYDPYDLEDDLKALARKFSDIAMTSDELAEARTEDLSELVTLLGLTEYQGRILEQFLENF